MSSENNEEGEYYEIAYCETCNIVRPPRSFHCAQCNLCIELHDHHCPWAGTCIGKRNLRLFSVFLSTTFLHAIVTFLITLSQSKIDFRGATVESSEELVDIFMLVYSGMFSLTLFIFIIHQNKLILLNVTTNENIRKKWNAIRKNFDQ